MRKRQLAIVSGVLITATALFAILAFRQEAQDKIKPHPDDATPIQIGVMTDRQRLHSKLYDGHGDGQKIVDLLKTHKEVSIVWGEPSEGGEPSTPRPSINSFVEETTCKSSAVVTGTVVGKESQITNDGDFIFTDYMVKVETVLKNNAAESIRPMTNIVVSRPGGKVRINGHLVAAIDQSSKPFDIGDQYVLFLRGIAGTDDYSTIKGTGSVSALDGKLDDITGESAESLLKGSSSSTVIGLIKTATSVCSQKP